MPLPKLNRFGKSADPKDTEPVCLVLWLLILSGGQGNKETLRGEIIGNQWWVLGVRPPAFGPVWKASSLDPCINFSNGDLELPFEALAAASMWFPLHHGGGAGHSCGHPGSRTMSFQISLENGKTGAVLFLVVLGRSPCDRGLGVAQTGEDTCRVCLISQPRSSDLHSGIYSRLWDKQLDRNQKKKNLQEFIWSIDPAS